MKKTILLVGTVLLFTLSMRSQSPVWQWANTFNGIDYNGSMGSAVVSDSIGNTYVTGTLSSDSVIMNSTILPDAGVFIAKYDSSGAILWGKGARKGFASGQGIAIDASGNSFISGYFNSDTLILGADTMIRQQGSGAELFIAKFDNSGNEIWAKHFGGDGNDQANRITCTRTGNIFITGFFSSRKLIIGADTLINRDTTGSSLDCLIAGFSQTGNSLWARSAGGTNIDEAISICTDANNFIWITGAFYSSSVSFDTISISNYSSTFGGDIFVAKYNTNGNLLLVKNFSSDNYSNDASIAIASDAMGNVFITGEFSGDTLRLGSLIALNSAPCSGTFDLFFCKIDSAGNPLWVRTGIGTSAPCAGSDEFGSGISVDLTGAVYTTGEYEGYNITFGSTVLPNTNPGSSDLFVVKYDSSGNFIYGMSAVSSNNEYPAAIAARTANECFVTGYFGGATISFGNNTLINSCVFPNSADFFLTKLRSDTTTLGIETIPEFSFHISPNPSSGKFSLQFENNFSGIICITNILGEIIYQTEINNSNQEIDLSSQPDGIYFVNVKAKVESFTQKIIIQK
ncbi:MAG: T9SS type A sorting domain-containing protein [Bacteroidetes bacterium]|nr:T9SS type A sorting domain-containing protein [Bacteroidota bacterium]